MLSGNYKGPIFKMLQSKASSIIVSKDKNKEGDHQKDSIQNDSSESYALNEQSNPLLSEERREELEQMEDINERTSSSVILEEIEKSDTNDGTNSSCAIANPPSTNEKKKTKKPSFQRVTDYMPGVAFAKQIRKSVNKASRAVVNVGMKKQDKKTINEIAERQEVGDDEDSSSSDDEKSSEEDDRNDKDGIKKLSKVYDQSNLCFCICLTAVASAWLISVIGHFCYFIYSFLFLRGIYRDLAMEKVRFLPKSGEMLFLCLFVCLFGHRVLGYLVSLYLRSYLQRSFGGEDKDKGSYRIHFAWLSIRAPVDRFELVISNLVWKNHPLFNKSPFFLRIGEVAIAIKLQSLISFLLRRSNVLNFECITINSPEVFFENSTDSAVSKRYAMNLWAAIGASPAKAKASKLQRLGKRLLRGLNKQMKLFSLGNMSDLLQLRREKVMGSTDEEPEMLEKELEQEEELLAAELYAAEAEDEIDESQQADDSLSVNSDSPPPTQSTASASASAKPAKPAPELLFEINRLVIFGLKAHPMDLLSNDHVKVSTSTDIRVPFILVRHKDMTAPPAKEGQRRRPQTLGKVIEGLTDVAAKDIFLSNSINIIQILGSATANQVKSRFVSVLSRIIPLK